MAGFVYAIQLLIPDYVQPIKIGYSDKPELRLKVYHSEPFPVRWLGSWRAEDRIDEKLVHKRFDDYRMCGEWFYPAPRLVDFIETQLKRAGSVQGYEMKRVRRPGAVENAHRWNLARLAARNDRVDRPWAQWDENAEFLSAVFDRSDASHDAMKSGWRW